jgi:two-component system nitrogen regulation response regulator NtrX
MASDILIVDDEADIRELVAGILQDEGHGTRTARDSDDALNAIVARRPNLVFLDIWLQGSRLDGLQLLDSLKQEHPELPIVMISGHGNIETAVSAIKRGAYDFIEKPFKADRLLLVADRALENSRLKREVRELKQSGPIAAALIGHSPAANQLRQTVEKVAPTNSRILIVGPSGSGKELAARTIHAHSARAEGPFVVINAAAITPEHMEIELFGVEPGNSGNGGPHSRKVGALEEAHGGTLFIDEIADMPRETQNKILRVLVDQTFERVGGSTKVTVDVRIVSSTSRHIEADIAAGKFREDLYHRLSVVPIRVPGLAERREDIPGLVEYFMTQISQTTGLPKRKVGADALAVLQSHDWPGNVRQLRNNVERLMILAGGDPDAVITASMLPQDVGSMIPNMPNGNGGEHLMSLALREAREVFEREYLLAQINRFGGNISRTAEFVGMERSALHRKLKALGID